MTGVRLDKMFVFYDKFCVRSDEYVSVIVKIKCVNSGNISDICNKLNFTTNYIYLPKHTQKLQFLTISVRRSGRES